ncbi:hypothetical protein Ddc_23039 [Ditylenchus destructor]|nr:hypothetical protein Ddc_23039 [Ditylenchus destructor]
MTFSPSTLFFNFSLEHSLKWLKDNVRAQNITISFNDNIPYPELHSLVLEFLFLDASICARDRIKLDWLPHPGEFVKALIKKYETLEVTKAIPSILIEEFGKFEIYGYFESNLVHQDYPTLIDKLTNCDECTVKSYELQNKMDGNRKIIAQVSRCYVGWDCPNDESVVYIKFE